MSISPNEIEKIAQLARLKISDDEKKVFSNQVNQILQYVEKLDEIDTSQVEPLSHTVDLKNVYREDIVKPSLPQEKALENAPSKTDKFFRVPKVVSK